MKIEALPLDVWVIVMRHIGSDRLLETFNTLFSSRALNVPVRYKLDTFWIIVSQARHLYGMEEQALFPNVDTYRTTLQQLQEMGVSREDASRAVSISNGNLDDAMLHLWQL